MASTTPHLPDADSTADLDDYELDENVAVDLVRYVRSNTIRNEQQFLLLTLAYTSGLFDDTHDYISSVTIGTSSSGKTHLKDKVDALFTEWDVYDASTGTDKSLVHDNDWDGSDVISMGELQQPSEEMLEFMKRAHGGDEEVVIKVTMGNPSTGFEVETIRRPAKSYHFTYAQFDADFEFWNRLLKIAVHESESKNRAVGKMKAGYDRIEIEDGGVQYGYDFPHGTRALQNHMADVKDSAPKRVVLPTGEDYEWDCWHILEPIFNHGRSEVNRIYGMVFSLVKSSALLNYKHRDRTTVVVEDEGNISYEDAIIAEPQDVANVVRCLRELRATTHEIDRKKRTIVEAIRAKSGNDDAIEGIDPIREFISEADASELKQDELEALLDDLRENWLINIIEGAGADGQDIYRAYKWDKLGTPRIDENADLFEGCVDPMTGKPFLDAWDTVKEDLETTAQDMLESATFAGDASGSGPSSSGRTGGAARAAAGPATVNDGGSGAGGLGAYGGGVGGEPQVELEPWVETVLERITPVIDGKRIADLSDVPVESFLGLTSLANPDKRHIDVEGSMLDPDHDVWDQQTKPDDWVETETQARRELTTAIETCIDAGIIQFEEIHDTEDGKPVDATLGIDTSILS